MELLNSSEMDKLSYEIFSILESKFLFDSLPQTPVKTPKSDNDAGKVRILSIDGGVGACDGLLAAVSLARLESSLRSRSGDSKANIADYFDLAAGSGAGGVLAAMLFTRGADGKPLYSAADALAFLSKNQQLIASAANKKGLIRGLFKRSGGIFRRTFGEATLRDTLKPVLIPCFDLASGAPFVFSRADAMENDAYDFKISAACAATCADRAVEMSSVDGRTKIVAVGGGVAMENPTAAAITHVLNNKMEFPFANGVDDLLVVSLGSGDSNLGSSSLTRAQLVKMAGSAAADTVDQAVAMAFGHNSSSSYVRIQASNTTNNNKEKNLVRAAEEMLTHRSVESVLFRGKKISEQSNAEKLESSCAELMKEQERRKWSLVPTVVMKLAMTPRSSSATVSTIATTTTTATSASP